MLLVFCYLLSPGDLYYMQLSWSYISQNSFPCIVLGEGWPGEKAAWDLEDSSEVAVLFQREVVWGQVLLQLTPDVRSLPVTFLAWTTVGPVVLLAPPSALLNPGSRSCAAPQQVPCTDKAVGLEVVRDQYGFLWGPDTHPVPLQDCRMNYGLIPFISCFCPFCNGQAHWLRDQTQGNGPTQTTVITSDLNPLSVLSLMVALLLWRKPNW